MCIVMTVVNQVRCRYWGHDIDARDVFEKVAASLSVSPSSTSRPYLLPRPTTTKSIDCILARIPEVALRLSRQSRSVPLWWIPPSVTHIRLFFGQCRSKIGHPTIYYQQNHHRLQIDTYMFQNAKIRISVCSGKPCGHGLQVSWISTI